MERLTAKWKPGLYDVFDPIDVADNEYSKINFEKLLTKLGEYEDAEERGLLRKLPVAVGTKVYYPLRPCGFTTFTIVKIKIYEDEIIFEDDCRNEWEERHFGKVIFLTREEAESALAEKGGV